MDIVNFFYVLYSDCLSKITDLLFLKKLYKCIKSIEYEKTPKRRGFVLVGEGGFEPETIIKNGYIKR